jgi:hypothetical protein
MLSGTAILAGWLPFVMESLIGPTGPTILKNNDLERVLRWVEGWFWVWSVG